MSASSISDKEPPSVGLAYSIASSSPHSGKYVPQNIIEDKPMDQSSRWSGAFQGNASQWIMLELESLSILSTLFNSLFELLVSSPFKRDNNIRESKQIIPKFEALVESDLHSSRNVR